MLKGCLILALLLWSLLAITRETSPVVNLVGSEVTYERLRSRFYKFMKTTVVERDS